MPHATWSKIQRRRQHHSLITIHAIITLHYTHLSPLTIRGLQLSCGSIHRTCPCGSCNCMKRPTRGSLKTELDQKSAPRLATLIQSPLELLHLPEHIILHFGTFGSSFKPEFEIEDAKTVIVKPGMLQKATFLPILRYGYHFQIAASNGNVLRQCITMLYTYKGCPMLGPCSGGRTERCSTAKKPN
jgi:hypothetical protein